MGTFRTSYKAVGTSGNVKGEVMQTIFEAAQSNAYHWEKSLESLVMPQHTLFIKLSLVPLLLLGSVSNAQNLTLFEPVESSANGGAAEAAAREQRNLPNTPAFTLLGTSRIGSKRRVSLIDSSGEVVVVEISDDDSTPIPDNPGYRIVALNSGKVSISLPSGTPCFGASDKGVQCGSDGLAELSLTTAAPIVVASNQQGTEGQSGQAEGAEEGQPENPFAAALRAAAQNEAAAQGGRPRRLNSDRFEARRIAPEDVPPGMRVVRTPFGDRLVEL